MQQADTDIEATLHAARELAYLVVCPLRQADDVQHLGSSILECLASHAVQPPEERQVLPCSQIGVDRQILRYEVPGSF